MAATVPTELVVHSSEPLNNLSNNVESCTFFWKEEFYSDENSTKKYSVGIIDMIKLRNIYNTYTYIPIYI